jgi:REP element-mobilizing transposase RayT
MDLISEWCSKQGMEIWAYCLMPNHVYLIAVPQSIQGLALAIGEAHRRYTRESTFAKAGEGISGALRILCPGRGTSYRRCALHRTEPRLGSLGKKSRRIPSE